MNKPDDIPQDVWDGLPKPEVTYADHSYPAYSRQQLARVIVGERERCAKVADQYVGGFAVAGDDASMLPIPDIIAAAIRSAES